MLGDEEEIIWAVQWVGRVCWLRFDGPKFGGCDFQYALYPCSRGGQVMPGRTRRDVGTFVDNPRHLRVESTRSARRCLHAVSTSTQQLGLSSVAICIDLWLHRCT